MRWLLRRQRGPILDVLLLALAAAAGAGVWVIRGSAHPGTIGVTWTGTASRILQTRCVTCHGAGGDTRPRLDTYADARAASQGIKQAALSGHPPGWYAAPGFGEFVNGPALSAHEAEMLAQWVDGRTPHGDGLPPAVSGAVAPGLDAPSIVLTVPVKHRVTEATHTFELGPAFEDAQWIRGWVFEPGNRALVTGAVISLSSGRALGTWAPGDGATLLPEGVGLRVPARSVIRLTVHYRRPPGPAVDASRVGFYVSAAPRRELESMVLPCGPVRLPRDIAALALRAPGASATGSVSVVARRPDRSLEPLAWFQNATADHTQTYRFRDAVMLPRGTSIYVDAHHGTCGLQLDYVEAGEPVVPRAIPAVAPLDPGALAELWCPMHADMRASAPGVCSRCGMTLVPMQPRVEGQYWLDAAVRPVALRAGTPATLRLAVREPGTRTIVREFETVHDRRFHLFVVSDDMREFSHVHPVEQPDGTLELPFTFTRPGAYRVYADFLPVGGTPQMIGKTVLVDGAGPEAPRPSLPRITRDLTEKTDRGVRVQLHFESGELVAGIPSLVAFSLEDAASAAPVVDLEPFLGAWGHMFILGGDLATAVHSHPTTPLSSPGGPKVYFYQRFPRAGTYRIWVQFQRAGAVVTVPFTVEVTDRQQTN